MKTIRKGIEPSSLTQHRLSGADANYEAYREKSALRDALATEQRGLCCYCLSNIRSSVASMKIEHWHSRSKYPNEQLDYGNLLGACKGNDGGPPHYHHCDTKKKNTELSRNPSNPNHHVEDLVRFGNRGEIRSLDDRFNDELNLVLNLNLPGLRSQRIATLEAFRKTLGKRKLSRPAIEKLIREWNGETEAGELRPYCQVVVYWLRKRLARP